uniref:Immunoglobulin domain-containing protein n=1 Tax=Anabas testudineus TaxID=64144 RepID=A0A3Q1H1G4_ANATE
NIQLLVSVLPVLILNMVLVAGLHSITTVSEVSVKAGGSISIPCLYDSKYTHHVKYLCRGHKWVTCSYTVKTDEAGSSQRFSISDDKDQRIFTVTINNLTDDDSHYWCIVEIKDGSDVGKYFRLSVTRGSPLLYVDHQEMTGFNGDDVTISCYHSISGEGGWCRLGGSCVMESSGSIDGTTVIINVNVPGAFTVTMRGLRTESSGWYFCVKGDLQMPVHLTVNEKQERPSTSGYQTTHDILLINICHLRVDGIGQVLSSAWFHPDMTLGIQAKEFNLCFIRPENLVSHALRVLQVHLGCHVPFTGLIGGVLQR